MKSITADYYRLNEGFFEFYEDPLNDNEDSLKFTTAASDVSTIEKV